MEYKFNEIEKRWQQYWVDNNIYKIPNLSDKPKYYVLDMFPYPSGAGLHVGHPLGYIASDIYARYKRLKGFNVLHPMGYDAFGLPAEQYAIEHGIHPAVSTANNIETFRKQLDNIGFCYDWNREVRTSDPKYYKWTQWIFLQLFKSWFNRATQKAEPIEQLITIFETEGNVNHPFPSEKYQISNLKSQIFSASDWKNFDEATQQQILMEYRLAYCGYGEVNWCEALGTVLANDEVVNGVSERGGHPVVKKKLRQWYLRITEYADRLLQGLQKVDFSDAMKDMQTNWIGKSSGAEISFEIQNSKFKIQNLVVYTTRPDTIMGVDFMVIAPEHELVRQITTPEQQQEVDDYIEYVNSRSERERISEKKITGAFTGAYCINPFDETKEIPIWISEYVLAGYGTGAIMAVPCGDERDYKFAKQFKIPITNIIGEHFNGEDANATKDAVLSNSGFLDGVPMREAMEIVINEIEKRGIGKRKVNYKMRDAAFSRQRYWGEPFPIKWIDGIAYPMDETDLPLELPEVETYKPGPEGEGPLANIPDWTDQNLETNTMPGYAGSSWYFLRYMDPQNDQEFASRQATDYWNQVDLYIGGTEHAVGHLLYSRMWTKALYDLGYLSFDEPFKKLVNQGMIQGSSRFVYRMNNFGISNLVRGAFSKIDERYRLIPCAFDDNINTKFNYRSNIEGNEVEWFLVVDHYSKISSYESIDPIPDRGLESKKIIISDDEFLYYFLSKKFALWIQALLESNQDYYTQKIYNKHLFKSLSKNWDELDSGEHDSIHVDVNIVDGVELDIEKFKQWRNGEYANAEFILEDGKYICGTEVEKMSKSKFNTVNPDDLVEKYGADTFRMYEMFLGPVEMSKPWDTKGIEGVHRFLKKLWRLFFKDNADGTTTKIWNEDPATDSELKILHKAIKKLEDDTERFSFNTGVSAFMIVVNELTDAKCHKRSIMEPVLIMLAPYAPHIAEELWHILGNENSVLDAQYPVFEAKHVQESTKEYPISINGKLRTTLQISLNATQDDIEQIVLANEIVKKWVEGKTPKKIIYVKNKMVNIVV